MLENNAITEKYLKLKAALQRIHDEASRTIAWHSAKVRVAQNPRMPLSVAIQLKREIEQVFEEDTDV